jgi:hypothetical protein
MGTKIVPGVKGCRPDRKANSLTAIWEPIVYKMWEPWDVSQLCGPPQPVTVAAWPFFAVNNMKIAVAVGDTWQ